MEMADGDGDGDGAMEMDEGDGRLTVEIAPRLSRGR
jgi:hypothetical protein